MKNMKVELRDAGVAIIILMLFILFALLIVPSLFYWVIDATADFLQRLIHAATRL